MGHKFLLAVAAVVLTAAASAPDAHAGFNCAVPSVVSEAKRTVCNDRHLSSLNHHEDTDFITLRTRLIPAARLIMVRDHTNFVRTRAACGSDKRCLEATYNAQLRLYTRMKTCFVKRMEQSACVATTVDKHRQDLHKSM